MNTKDLLCLHFLLHFFHMTTNINQDDKTLRKTTKVYGKTLNDKVLMFNYNISFMNIFL